MDRTGWDGTPNAREAPFGASVIVYRQNETQTEFLILHRGESADSVQLTRIDEGQSTIFDLVQSQRNAIYIFYPLSV